jgi:acetylglutamate kinase
LEKLTIIKIGGNVVDDENQLHDFLYKLSQLSGSIILVHGGGKLATQLAEKMNIPVHMIEGRRITDAETLKIATMVYAGYINKNIVALLQKFKRNALGLSGADGNCILATKRKHASIDYGFVGDVTYINTDLFVNLLNSHITPVMCAITHTGEGQLLNTNADTIVAAIAIALSKKYDVTLTYCFEKSGVLADVSDDTSVIEHIHFEKYIALKKEGNIHSGMIPKLDNAFEAINQGVTSVIIGHAQDIHELGKSQAHKGTRLSR